MNLLKKIFGLLLTISFLLVGCGDELTNEPVSVSNPSSEQNTDNSSTENNPKNAKKPIDTYKNEHGNFEVLYFKENLNLKETYEDFGLELSSIEYGEFSVSDAYEHYPELEDKDGKIGYLKVHIAMDLPASLDPALFFLPHQTTLIIPGDGDIDSHYYSDNNFADEVAVNLGEVAKNEGYLFYLLSPSDREKLVKTNSFTLTSFAPFTSKNMDFQVGYTFNLSLD